MVPNFLNDDNFGMVMGASIGSIKTLCYLQNSLWNSSARYLTGWALKSDTKFLRAKEQKFNFAFSKLFPCLICISFSSVTFYNLCLGTVWKNLSRTTFLSSMVKSTSLFKPSVQNFAYHFWKKLMKNHSLCEPFMLRQNVVFSDFSNTRRAEA